MNRKNFTVTLRETVLFGVLGALTFALKFAMAGLPNIEPVTLLVLLYAVTFGKKALYPIYIYVLMEFLVYGLQLWSICYLYIWLIPFAIACLFRTCENTFVWAAFSGAFGLCFGLLCTPVYFVTGGLTYALSWWVSGVPYDLLHCVGNLTLALVLFHPLRNVMHRMKPLFFTEKTKLPNSGE